MGEKQNMRIRNWINDPHNQIIKRKKNDRVTFDIKLKQHNNVSIWGNRLK